MTVAGIVDEHRALLWETCAHADDLTTAIASRRRVRSVHRAMLRFLHRRLLAYLDREEQQLARTGLRDARLTQLLLTDHARLRADVANLEASRTPELLAMATVALVDRLDRHVQREEAWMVEPL